MRSRRRGVHLVIGLVTSLILCIVAEVLWHAPVLTPLDVLDQHVHDRLLLARNQQVPVPGFRRFYPEVVLVTVDDDSLERLGRWPWPRSRFARLFDRLGQARARVVASDLLFGQASESQVDDARLATSMRRLPRLVLGTLYRRTLSDDVVVEAPLGGRQTLPPSVRSASVGVEADRDGVLRRIPVAIPMPGGGAPLPALAVAACAAYQGVPPDAIRLADDATSLTLGDRQVSLREGRARIDWPVPDLRPFQAAQTYREAYPICEVVPFHVALDLPDSTMRKVFEDRIVLLGATAQAFDEDVKTTPVGPMPGLMIHASFLIGLLEGRFLTEWPHEVDLVALVTSALVLSWVMGRTNPVVGLGVAIALFGAWYGIAGWLFEAKRILVGVAAPALNLVVFGALLVQEYRVTVRERNRIRSAFGGYLSPAVVQHLVEAEHEGRLGLEGKKERITVFFSDIRSFTAYSEETAPEEVVRSLNEYFTAAAEVAVRHGGYIDKYGGDSMMIIFSAPLPRNDDALRAVEVAWEIQQRLGALCEKRALEGRPPLRTGIGLATGEAVLGNIGSPVKMNFTAIGDRVNLAARLCAAAEGGQVLICSATQLAVRHAYSTRALPAIRVKGKREPVEVYEVTGRGGGAPDPRSEC